MLYCYSMKTIKTIETDEIDHAEVEVRYEVDTHDDGAPFVTITGARIVMGEISQEQIESLIGEWEEEILAEEYPSGY